VTAIAISVFAHTERNQVQKGLSNMIDRWIIDVEKSIVGAALLRVEPKMQRSNKEDPKSPMVHGHDKDNVPKWTVHLSIEQESFEKPKFENIQITVTSPKQPCEGVPQYTPVTIQGLALGQMPRGNSGGVSVFYVAESIRPLQSTQFTQPGQSTRVTSGQPLQPARVAPGQ
jgi:hypothetical protein